MVHNEGKPVQFEPQMILNIFFDAQIFQAFFHPVKEDREKQVVIKLTSFCKQMSELGGGY